MGCYVLRGERKCKKYGNGNIEIKYENVQEIDILIKKSKKGKVLKVQVNTCSVRVRLIGFTIPSKHRSTKLEIIKFEEIYLY